jgi:hypothetical protein
MTSDQPQRRVPLALPEDRARTSAALFGGCFLWAAVFAAGCGSSRLASGDASSDASCSSASPPKPPPATDAGATSQAAIEAPWLALLDQAFGQYLRGDVLAYRGTMQGSATVPPGYDPLSDGTIAEGAALASLAFRPGSVNDWAGVPNAPATFVDGNQAVLVVHSLAGDQLMVFEQPESDPTMIATGGIVVAPNTDPLRATCSGCASNLWARPSAIAFDLAAAGTFTTYGYGADGGTTSVDQPVNATASLQMAVVPPCTLTFDDFKTLNEVNGPDGLTGVVGIADFVLIGGEWVQHVAGIVETKPPSAQGQCDGQSFDYTVDLYMDAANPADYGVRNYVQGTPYSVCAI